ncbi:unnamed protein product [Gongylonema pulchrum]|uniref:FAT domain-containing protein n=1 Tax=Gongylonema pulchrum TaxID=637853 RepID=A0A183DPP0_9BILA|nr:unnamed protein product [Gongylonema pulchrum]
MKRQDRISAEGKAFSLLLSAVANEMDRLLYKSNVMFNGAPTVPPDALISVMAAQLNQITTENPGSATSTKTTEHYLLAKSLIQLARWLQAQPTLMQAAMCHSARLAFHVFGVEQSRLPLTGRSAPQLAKAHLELGNWAFNAATSAHGEARLSFADEECDMIRFYIKKVSIEADVLPTCKAIIGTKLDQRACAAMFGEGNVVSRIWKGANARLLAYCNSATRSYFTYIAMCGRQMDKGTIGTVRATLRILHLLITHHDALRHLILNEMLQTNELLWKDILPQLFARLNHPVRGVRDTLCTILERIAASAPHALCYPAIVGATQPIVVHCGDGGDDDVDAERVDFAEYLVTRMEAMYPELVKDVTEFVKVYRILNDLYAKTCTSVAATVNEKQFRDAYGMLIDEALETLRAAKSEPRKAWAPFRQYLVTRMEAMYPELVKDVTEFVKELQRIDMLHEERWIFVLSNLDYEMNRRIAQIEAEKAKTLSNSYLTIEQRRELIDEKTVILTSPLLTQLSSRSNRRLLMGLQMADIAPALATFNHRLIPLPGQEHKNFADVVMLERISKQTVILPTKTRPRKLVFHGSDGKELLLRICNMMLAEKERDWPSYTAQHYSVTPLGSRSGLIEWVEGATSIFQVYRKWQLRQAPASEIERPSELFMKKLKAYFLANKLPLQSLADRQKWPHTALKNVIQELIDETPKDLLSSCGFVLEAQTRGSV